jgi:hypothetical protein
LGESGRVGVAGGESGLACDGALAAGICVGALRRQSGCRGGACPADGLGLVWRSAPRVLLGWAGGVGLVGVRPCGGASGPAFVDVLASAGGVGRGESGCCGALRSGGVCVRPSADPCRRAASGACRSGGGTIQGDSGLDGAAGPSAGGDVRRRSAGGASGAAPVGRGGAVESGGVRRSVGSATRPRGESGSVRVESPGRPGLGGCSGESSCFVGQPIGVAFAVSGRGAAGRGFSGAAGGTLLSGESGRARDLPGTRRGRSDGAARRD